VTEPHFSRRLLGYDRAQVDAFVERTAIRLADAQKAHTPDAAVQEALDRLGDETSAILKHAHALADELTTRSRQDAEELTARSQQEAAELTARAQQESAARLQQAEHEAAAIRQGAERRVTELDAEIDSLWQERQQLLDDIERISEQFHALASGAKERFPAEEGSEAEAVYETRGADSGDGTPGAESVDETPGAVVVARDDAS
jgi:cell division septum initiation protein DivIVA